MYKICIIFLQSPADKFCQINSILVQVIHHPRAYTAEMMARQIGFHLLKNPKKFFPLVQDELLKSGESYESFCLNVFDGNRGLDDILSIAVVDMWKISVTLVTPTDVLNLFHKEKNPDVVLIVNGVCSGDKKKGVSHYSATMKKEIGSKLIGSEIFDLSLGIENIPTLMPTHLSTRADARQRALKEYVKGDQEESLILLKTVSESLNRMNSRINQYIEQHQKESEEKEVIEYNLEHLGINVEKIKEAGKLDPKKYVVLEEWEEHVSSVRGDKRKRQDDENEEKDPSKKTKTSEEEKEKNIDFYVKRYNQQAKIIEDNEEIIQTQANEIERKANEMQKLENNYEREIIKFQKEVLGYEKIIDTKSKKIEQLESELKRLKERKGDESETPDAAQNKQSSSTSESQKIVRRKEDSSCGEKSDIQESVLKGKSTQTIYIQKTIMDETSTVPELILVEKEKQKSTEKRSGKTHPVPEGLRSKEKKRYYCDNCSSHFTRKDSLEYHKKHNCCQEVRRHICKDCNKGFYSDTSVREHYYKDHLKKDLYFCKKCNQGFAHNSRKSTHIKSGKCPMKDEQDRFPGRAELDEELEQTFKEKEIAIPVSVQEADNPDEGQSSNKQQQPHHEQVGNLSQQLDYPELEDNQSKIRKDRMLSDSAVNPQTIDMGVISMIADSAVTSDTGLQSVGQSEVTGNASDILMQMSLGGGSLLNVKQEGIDMDYDNNGDEKELHLELDEDDDD